jgi:hypothetical protein
VSPLRFIGYKDYALFAGGGVYQKVEMIPNEVCVLFVR